MPPPYISVTISGTGNLDDCYAIINGTKQYRAGTHEVSAGDTITFGVRMRFSPGSVTIDGTQVLEATSTSTETYDWTVSTSGISTIEIAMDYTNFSGGKIIVTTA